MPHSTTDLPSQITTKTMASTTSHANGRLNGGASSTSLDNKWKRASLPASDIYGELRNPIDSGRVRSGSIISTASTAVVHRKSQYYESMHNPREKVIRESPMIAELRTNVIVSSSSRNASPPNRHADQRRIHTCHRPLISPRDAILQTRLVNHDQHRPQFLSRLGWHI